MRADLSPSETDPRLARLRAGLDGLRATLRLAQTIIAGGEAVDLAGLDEQVGRLCAGALDLPPSQGRELVTDLAGLAADAAALEASLRAALPGPA